MKQIYSLPDEPQLKRFWEIPLGPFKYCSSPAVVFQSGNNDDFGDVFVKLSDKGKNNAIRFSKNEVRVITFANDAYYFFPVELTAAVSQTPY